MNEKTRKVVVTVAVLLVMAGISAIIVTNGGRGRAEQAPPATPSTEAQTAVESAAAAAPTATPATTPAPTPVAPTPTAPLALVARAPGEPFAAGVKLGSLDIQHSLFELEMAPEGAGIKRIVFSDYWRTAAQSRQARDHRRAVSKAATDAPPMPPDEDRYSLQSPGKLQGYEVSLMAARYLQVDNSPNMVSIFGPVWSQTAPGTFETSVVNDAGVEQLRVVRRYGLKPESFDIAVEQRITNTGSVPRTVQWIQYGPPDLGKESGQLVETRRFQSGYLMSAARDPAQQTVIVHGGLLDHSAVLKQISTPGEQTIWPTPDQTRERYGLSWFGSTSRYFALATHAPYAPPALPSKLIAPAVARVEAQAGTAVWNGAAEEVVYTFTRSDTLSIPPGATGAFDFGLFAGPLDRTVLSTQQPFAALNMQGLILYLMSDCCSWCTFSWLADILIWFLSFLHSYVVFDWGLAIIALVVAVRVLLHPLSMKSQIAMQRVSKQMQALKPELDALKTRYGNDPKKMQEEQIRIYRERGINPLGCAGGMLPTFLQMPIWMALYAMLYFAFELRQQPAFFGVFQNFGGWGFLGDLSAPDGFIPLGVDINLYITHVSSINLIPLLMGVIFFVQQKYMTPPPSGPVTPEMESQQKMMKWMMVLLFPLMLYTAPSGLTLYIATSTLVGVFEGIQVRKVVSKMDFTKPQPKSDNWMTRAFEALQKRQSQVQKQQQQRAQQPRGPSRRFKDR
jgi:YidC/Oxa1 family membrane protein insertase